MLFRNILKILRNPINEGDFLKVDESELGFLAEYLPLKPIKKEMTMSILRTTPLLISLLALTNPSFGQSISKDYQKMCIREQVSEHKGVKGKALTEEDFTAYCICQAEFINKNATNQQLKELAMNPKSKPDWLKIVESKAMKSCISTNSKMGV